MATVLTQILHGDSFNPNNETCKHDPEGGKRSGIFLQCSTNNAMVSAMKSFLKWSAIGVLSLAIMLTGAVFLLPWQPFVARMLSTKLQQQGLPIGPLSIGEITLTYADFKDVVVTTDPPLKIPVLRIYYSKESLQNKAVESVEIRGLDYVFDLDAPMEKQEKQEKAEPAATEWPIPAPEQLAGIPLKQVTIHDSKITLRSEGVSATIPLTGEVEMQPALKMTFSGKDALIEPSGQEAAYMVPEWKVTALPEKSKWALTASVKGLYLPQEEQDGAETSVEGVAKWLPIDITSEGGTLYKEGVRLPLKVMHGRKEYRLSTVAAMSPKKGLRLSDLVLNAAEGRITAKSIDLSKPEDIAAKLTFEHLSLEPLLALAMRESNTLKARGKISGTLPIRYTRKKGLDLGDGSLHSDGAGVIAVGAEELGSLAGANEQMAQVADLLKNFQYTTLELGTQQDSGKKLHFQIKLKGRNPDVYQGQEVHLNVNLQGDVLEAISAYLGLYSLPEEILKGNKNAN